MGTLREDLAILSIPEGLTWAASPDIVAALEDDFLPNYLAKARWFPGGSGDTIPVRVVVAIPLRSERDTTCHLTIVETDPGSLYLIPLRVDWELGETTGVIPIARLYQGGREGVLLDVATDPKFILTLLDHLRKEASVATAGWRLDFRPTTRLGGGPVRRPVKIRAIQGEQSNSTSLVDQDYVVKIYRHIESGINPEPEMGRFLTDDANFAQTPDLLGNVEAVHDGKTFALGIVHTLVPNQGDAWAWSTERIRMYLDAAAEGSEQRDTAITIRREYLSWVRRMGQRVAEMHARLASRADIAAFAPESVELQDIDRWTANLTKRADRVITRLSTLVSDDETTRRLSRRLAAVADRLEKYTRQSLQPALGRPKIRQHGDLHLGQVLVSAGDAVIIDFEGEPSRPLADRRLKAPAARDVAGVLRSLDYAAMAACMERNSPSEQRALGVWREQSFAAFLTGYQDIEDARDLWPERREDAKGVLNVFLLAKAFYEVEYELAYRPRWLTVPLLGIVQLLDESNIVPPLEQGPVPRLSEAKDILLRIIGTSGLS